MPALVALALAACSGARPWVPSPETPLAGSLVIVGGAMEDPAIVHAFIELAGGPDAPIVVVPTAGAGEDFDDFHPGLAMFRHLGARRVGLLHTRDRDVADSEAFVAPLGDARGVWFSGGRQWRLADAYVGTRTHEALLALLERGGVIGGSSAGASILASFLVRGDPRTNTIVVGRYQQGFGFLPGTAIDQHLLARNRQFDLIPVIQRHPELLGIGIDENTAIVVQGDEFRVIGEGRVAIYDRGVMLDGGGPFYFLGPGDRFDLEGRRALRGDEDEPSGGIGRTPWPLR